MILDSAVVEISVIDWNGDLNREGDYTVLHRVAHRTSTALTAAWRTVLFVPESCHVCVIVTCVIRQSHNDKTSLILS